MSTQLFDQLTLPGLDSFRRRQHALLVLLERRRYVALGPGERLTPLIIGRDQVTVGVRDLDVVAENPIVAHLERRDTGALSLHCLDLRDRVLAAAPERTQFI